MERAQWRTPGSVARLAPGRLRQVGHPAALCCTVPPRRTRPLSMPPPPPRTTPELWRISPEATARQPRPALTAPSTDRPPPRTHSMAILGPSRTSANTVLAVFCRAHPSTVARRGTLTLHAIRSMCPHLERPRSPCGRTRPQHRRLLSGSSSLPCGCKIVVDVRTLYSRTEFTISGRIIDDSTRGRASSLGSRTSRYDTPPLLTVSNSAIQQFTCSRGSTLRPAPSTARLRWPLAMERSSALGLSAARATRLTSTGHPRYRPMVKLPAHVLVSVARAYTHTYVRTVRGMRN